MRDNMERELVISMFGRSNIIVLSFLGTIATVVNTVCYVQRKIG
jgi:hypothetical protein